MKKIQGKGIVGGKACGRAVVSERPFGFFGGVNPKTGVVIDKWHELYGESIKGKVFIYPEGRGSTVGSRHNPGTGQNRMRPLRHSKLQYRDHHGRRRSHGKDLLRRRYTDDRRISKEELMAIPQDAEVEVDGDAGIITVL